MVYAPCIFKANGQVRHIAPYHCTNTQRMLRFYLRLNILQRMIIAQEIISLCFGVFIELSHFIC